MESQKLAQVGFIFPQPEHTPEYTRHKVKPVTSYTNSPELSFTTAIPDPATESRTSGGIEYTDEEPLLSQFSRLTQQSRILISTHGPYTTYSGTSIFTRAPTIRNTAKEVSMKDVAISFAAAQDCIYTAQVDGPAREDLKTFQRLWETTIAVLESLLDASTLDYVTMGWGIYGLSTGYIGHASWREDSPFLSFKLRLHTALRKMPTMNSTIRKEIDSVACCGGKVEVLAKANREIHICANLLLQQFRREKWERIRWYHAIAVAQRWIEHLGLKAKALMIDEKGIEAKT